MRHERFTVRFCKANGCIGSKEFLVRRKHRRASRGKRRSSVGTCRSTNSSFKAPRPFCLPDSRLKLMLAHDSSRISTSYLTQTSPSDLTNSKEREDDRNSSFFWTVETAARFYLGLSSQPVFICEHSPLMFQDCVT